MQENCVKMVSISKSTWRDAFRYKAVSIRLVNSESHVTFGYKCVFYLWSADIWFDWFPLLKFIVLANVIVWILLFVLGR